MSGLIVITGLEQLAPSERWERLIATLASKLEESGLGEVPDIPELARELHTSGRVEACEVAIRLRSFHYGMELVEQVLRTAGLERVRRRPERWTRFDCDDYFASPYAEDGYFDEPGQYWYVVPFDRVFENEEADFLDVGGAGVDGIRFGYRRDCAGLWAYPVDGEYVFLADTVDELLRGWLSGEITV